MAYQFQLTASDGTANDFFGWSVAVTGKKTKTAVISAADRNLGAGAAYVFTESGGTWTQTVEVSGSDTAQGDEFGFSVAISRKGDIVIGAPQHNSKKGAAYVF